MSPLASTLAATLQTTARQFHELAEEHEAAPWRDFLRAWGELREADILKRDGEGRYYIGDGQSED